MHMRSAQASPCPVCITVTTQRAEFQRECNEQPNHAVRHQARIQGVGAGARAHPWGGVSPFKMHYSIRFKHQYLHHWAPTPGRNPVSAPGHLAADEATLRMRPVLTIAIVC